MGFTVYFQFQPSISFDSSHKLNVHDSGVLEITQNGDQKYLYSPSYWTHVRAETATFSGES